MTGIFYSKIAQPQVHNCAENVKSRFIILKTSTMITETIKSNHILNHNRFKNISSENRNPKSTTRDFTKSENVSLDTSTLLSLIDVVQLVYWQIGLWISLPLTHTKHTL